MKEFVAIGTNLSEAYFPLIDRIDQIVVENGKSRSSVVRDILCEYFGFVPEQVARPYSSMKNLMVEC